MSASSDFDFYAAMAEAGRFQFAGRHPEIESSPDGVAAREAFEALDSRGQRLPTSEPDLLRSVLRVKASVNLHIKMWAQGCAEGTSFLFEFLDLLRELNAPGWVEKALRNQTDKLRGEMYADPREWPRAPGALRPKPDGA